MIFIKIWLDDIRPAPDNSYFHCRSVDEAKAVITLYELQNSDTTIILDLDYDLGDYYENGGDAVKLLDWLEERRIVDTDYFFRLHTANPVGAENMRRIIEKNGWRELF